MALGHCVFRRIDQFTESDIAESCLHRLLGMSFIHEFSRNPEELSASAALIFSLLKISVKKERELCEKNIPYKEKNSQEFFS